MGLPPSLRWLPLAALLVVLAVRASYWAELERSPLSLWHLWEETDEHAFLEWSARLAGDWRDVPAFRAYFHWQEEIGSRADWDGWYERNAYYSGPLYPYGLALLRVLFRDPVLPARGLQIALAVAATAVLAVAVRRVLGALGDGPAAAGWRWRRSSTAFTGRSSFTTASP